MMIGTTLFFVCISLNVKQWEHKSLITIQESTNGTTNQMLRCVTGVQLKDETFGHDIQSELSTIDVK